ncbi:MAG: RND family transporter [Bacteroidia bacterium]
MNPVWQAIATIILRGRTIILILVAVLTVFMWTVRGTETDQAFGKVAPQDDVDFIAYQAFKAEFGEDGNVVAIAVEGPTFELDFFNGLYDLTEDLQAIRGSEGVLSVTHLFQPVRVDSAESFGIERVSPFRPQTQSELDSLSRVIKNLSFYKGLLFDSASNTSLIAVTLNRDLLDTKDKLRLSDEIMAASKKFEKRFGVDLKHAGLPLLRANVHQTIVGELILFLLMAVLVMAATLLFFFRSISTVVLPLIVVGIVIIWSLGIIGLLGYKITLIISVIPALITVIGIPNSVYLITKYHLEYRITKNKAKSLIRIIEKIGIVTVMTNATTAVGFGVLAFTEIRMLQEFGIVASLSVGVAFFVSLMLIPIFFSFLPPPGKRQVKHLDRTALNGFIRVLDKLVHHHRWAIYTVVAGIAVISALGMTKLVPVSYMVDDLPSDATLVSDLRYIEDRYNGVMPFEIVVDGLKKNAMSKRSNLKRLDKLQAKLTQYPELSRSISLADFVKFTRQAFWRGDANAFVLPSRDEYNTIKLFLKNSSKGLDATFSKAMTDSTFQRARVSVNIKDIGSIRMAELVDSVQRDLAVIFPEKNFKTNITGTTRIFINSNKYLVQNLLQSLLIAFMVIAVLMGMLFRSTRMVIISLVPNVLPLLMVAGMMGYIGIPLKPSTALVFSVAFGIAVDDSIHFLARYRLARNMGDTVSQAVTNSYKDTGISMIYTSIILFLGFVIFTASSFGGTRALGQLASVTLLIAMFGNLLLLPALLLSFDTKEPRPKNSSQPLEPRVLVRR